MLFKVHLCCIFLVLNNLWSIAQNQDDFLVNLISHLPVQQPFNPTHLNSTIKLPYIYILGENDLYDLFGYEVSSKFRKFDFKVYHILGIPTGDNYQNWRWLMRENQKVFEEIPATTILDVQHSYIKDTMISSSIDSLSKWYTTSFGDCHATFEYQVFLDNLYPVLLLKEKDHYGGCRAMRIRKNVIIFKTIPKDLWRIKKTIFLK